jgi:hypothetical protein
MIRDSITNKRQFNATVCGLSRLIVVRQESARSFMGLLAAISDERMYVSA